MKKKLLLFGLSLFFILSLGLYADQEKPPERIIKYKAPWTPVRFCLFPMVGNWPESYNVYGLNLGLANSLPSQYRLNGLDLAWFICLTESVNGMQLSAWNDTKYSAGMQMGIGNLFYSSGGFQMGLFFNYADNSDGMQLGIVNYAENKSVQFQLGLINYLENGFLPWFPIINFSFQ